MGEILDSDACVSLSPSEREAFASNVHCKRADFDAKMLVRGSEDSRLFERAVPLSAPNAGATATTIVTELSNDSGKGPWWRRRLGFDAAATEARRELGSGQLNGQSIPNVAGRD